MQRFDPSAHPAKLNLGCGPDIRPGYLNVDLNAWFKPDLVADVRELRELPSRHYEEAIAQDVLEHLPRTATLSTLFAWNRVLRDGARLVVRVPSILGIADLLRGASPSDPAAHEALIQCLFGTQAYTGDFHHTAFTELLLRHYLGRAGFRVLSIELRDGWLFDVAARKERHFERSELPDFTHLLEVADPAQFVDRCYREILLREPDEGGRRFYLDGLTKGGLARAEVVQVMLGSGEYNATGRGAKP